MSKVNAAFAKLFNGQPNFMTPSVIRRGNKGNYGYELSTGEGFGGDSVYGVTVIKLCPLEKTALSACFDTREGAESFIASGFKF